MLNSNTTLKPISIAAELIKGTGHAMGNAIVYGVTKDGSNFELSRGPNVYDLLEGEFPSVGIVGLAAHTTGWAAPLGPDGESECAPSAHPKRRRIALVLVITAEGGASALSFADDPNDLEIDEGSGDGDLVHALRKCLSRISRQMEDFDGLL